MNQEYIKERDLGVRYYHQSNRVGETCDCAVRALSFALGLPYEVSHRVLKNLGRKNRQGFWFGNICHRFPRITTVTAHGYNETRLRYNNVSKKVKRDFRIVSVAQFKKEHPKGTYMVETFEHIFVVKDGITYDYGTDNHRKVVKMWYKID